MSATARLMAFLGMDAGQFNAGVDNAEKRTKSFGSMLSGMKGKIAAAFTVGAAVGVAKDALAMGDAIGETASNLGVTTDELQALESMFKMTGSSAETFERALNKINGAIGDAQNGSKDATDKLTKMGVTMDQIDAGNPAAVLETMAKYLKENGYSAGATADVFDILGEKSKNLKNGLTELADKGLGGVVQSAKDAGKVLTEEEIAALGQAQDKVDGFIDRAKKAAAAIVGTGAKAVTEKATAQALPSTGAETRRRADEASADKLAKDAAEIRAKNAFDLLSTEDKILAVKKEMADLDAKMGEATTLTAKAELDKQKAELEGKLQGLEGQKQGPGMAFDQLTRIGAGVFSGRASDVVPKKQLDKMTAIERHLYDIRNKETKSGVF
jgi:uncharacterized protein YukE